MTRNYFFRAIIICCLFAFLACHKTINSGQSPSASIAGTYYDSGLYVAGSEIGVLFNDTCEITAISGTTYEASFPGFDTVWNTWKFSFEIDSATGNLINWEAEGNTYPVPQSGFFTEDNPVGFDYPPDSSNIPGTSPWLQTTYDNSYNSTTHTFWVHYGYGAGSSNQMSWTRMIYEKFVRKQ